MNTPEDWNTITCKIIQSNGGRGLFSNYSMFEIKCMACLEGKSIFDNPPQSSRFWENQEKINNFLSKIKEKYNLKTPEDWKRFSKNQIIQEGGRGLLTNKIYSKINIKFEMKSSFHFQNLFLGKLQKRSSQRWLFLQLKNYILMKKLLKIIFILKYRE